ncbi:PDDEXK-like family protein [Algoriphagus mannitolivorans]|uniref:PDDEXK-like family protein n=1 Tax=Algoriphagus mannitolivorans TaxID=226504 RepID=UPI0003FBCABF|nr:PD-(D/E)XK nuclease family protein [Algoriphagus mannitolivorans]
MSEISSARHLLSQVNLVVQNHEKFQKETGNAFSFTHALDIESDEVRLHTRLIGYLINPKAGHLQGDKFLKLFFDVIGIKEDTDGFIVEIEKHVGKRDWEIVEGGRIDLLISNSSRNIAYAFEIKIYALEQEKQLERYSKYLTNNFNSGESKVYFLTLEGNDSQYHKGFEKYEKISFREHIHKWIESCRLASIDQPIIRETLTQYIANIKRLTNQNPDNQMSQEIIELIMSSPESFKAYNAMKVLDHQLYQKFGDSLIQAINQYTDLGEKFSINFNNRNIPNYEAAISFFLGESKDFRVMLYWLGRQTIAIGMHIGSNPDSQLRSEVKNKLSDLHLGKYLDYATWVWLSEIDELNEKPLLSYESWQKFRSEEFALKIAGWVKTIAKAYEEISLLK